MISLCDPVLGEEEKKAVCDVLDSGWITAGDRVAEFEKTFATIHGVKNAVAVNSCTAGLHLSLAALDIGPGDEVLVPSLTFVATVNAILYVGALPVFVDIQDIRHPHISLEDAVRKMTKRIRAVIVMHYGGYIADLHAWRKFADAHNLKLIEDAAHCPATGDVGRISDAAAFSFFTNKNMTTAEGGMVMARENSVLKRIRQMRSHSMTTVTLDRHRGHAHSYDVTDLGYNYRLDEIRAAIGLVQLSRLSEWNARRHELADCYRDIIEKQTRGISVPFGKNHETAAHIMPVILPESANRKNVMDGLRKNGIQSSIHYPPVHRFSYHGDLFPSFELNNTERFSNRELTLPLHPGLDEKDVEMIVDVLRDLC